MEIELDLFKQWTPTVLITRTWSFSQFVDRVVLSIFRVFNPKVNRISKELNEILKPDLIGNWFLSQDHSLIRVFGFTSAPHILPMFLTSSIFSLELMRQRLQIDIEHFIAPKLKKISWIKYPLSVGNYILKKEAALPMIEEALKQYKFT